MRFSAPGPVDFLRGVAGVQAVDRRGHSVTVRGEPVIVARVGRALSEAGIEPIDMVVVRPALEDVYLHLVGQDGA